MTALYSLSLSFTFFVVCLPIVSYNLCPSSMSVLLHAWLKRHISMNAQKQLCVHDYTNNIYTLNIFFVCILLNNFYCVLSGKYYYI